MERDKSKNYDTFELVDSGSKCFVTQPKIDYRKRETFQLRDIRQTQLFDEILSINHLRGLADDILGDCHEITNDLISQNESKFYYPCAYMTSASVMNLSKESDASNDQFIKMLTDSFRGTTRNGSQAPTQFKLSFILTEGTSNSKTIEFSNDINYLIFISALKKLHIGEDVYVNGKCHIPSTNNNEGNRGILQLLTQSTISKDDCFFEIKSNTITVTQKNIILFTIEMNTIKAVTLSCDYEPIRPYLLEISLYTPSYISSTSHRHLDGNNSYYYNHTQPQSSDMAIAIVNDSNKPYISTYEHILALSSYYTKDTLLTPISEEDIQNNSLYYGYNKIALLNIDKLSGAEINTATDFNIPFASFVKQAASSSSSIYTNNYENYNSGNTANIDTYLHYTEQHLMINQPIYKKITLQNPNRHSQVEYRVVVRGASDLPTSGRKNIGPSSYCTIYLVNKQGEKLTSNTEESRTDVILESCDPTWNREFILKISHDTSTNNSSSGNGDKPGVYTGPLPSGVMLKVRDAASGILRHKNLGQVIIPINCFLLDTEASFCLPLEPTSRMIGSQASVGEIHITTQLLNSITTTTTTTTTTNTTTTSNGTASTVNMPSTLSADPSKLPPRTSTTTTTDPTITTTTTAATGFMIDSHVSEISMTPPPTDDLIEKKDRRKSTRITLNSTTLRNRASTSSSSTITVNSNTNASHMTQSSSSYNIHHPNPYPSQGHGHVNESGKTTDYDSTQKSNDESQVTLCFHIHKYIIWQVWWPFQVIHGGGSARGFLLCQYHHLLLRVLPGASGVLPTCKECSIPDLTQTETSTGPLSVKCTDIIIPWNQVSGCLNITDAILSLSITVSAVYGTPHEIAKHISGYMDTLVELIIAPCPSLDLRVLITHRMKMKGIRDELIKLAEDIYIPSTIISGKLVPHNRHASLSGAGTVHISGKESPPGHLRRLNSLGSTNNTTGNTGYSSKDSPVMTRNVRRESRRFSIRASVEGIKEMDGTIIKLIWNEIDIHEFLLKARIIIELLEEIIHESTPFIKLYNESFEKDRRSSIYTNIDNRQKPSIYYIQCPIISASSLLQVCRHYRAKCYSVVVLHLCEVFTVLASTSVARSPSSLNKHLLPPERESEYNTDESIPQLTSIIPIYNIIYIEQLIQHDTDYVTKQYPLLSIEAPGGDYVKSFMTRFDRMLECAIHRIRDYILCATGSWDSPLSSANNDNAVLTNSNTLISPTSTTTTTGTTTTGTILKGSSSPFKSKLSILDYETTYLSHNDTHTHVNDTLSIHTSKECLLSLISGYFNTFNLFLFPYIYSKEKFFQCKGQAFKSELLRYLIEKYSILDDRLQPALYILGLRCIPNMLLVDLKKLNQVVDWYAESLVMETKIWLANTIKNFYRNRRNIYDIPWDIEEDEDKVGSQLMSEFPETLMSTLSIYLELNKDAVEDHDYSSWESSSKMLYIPEDIGTPWDSDMQTSQLTSDINTPRNKGVDRSSNSGIKHLSADMAPIRSPIRRVSISGSNNGATRQPFRRSVSEISPTTSNSMKSPFSPSRENRQSYPSAPKPTNYTLENTDDIIRSFNEVRHRKKNMIKYNFLLKMNEKIVCAICQSLLLLANEYRRALQGKHWTQGDIDNGEVIANINFLIATGNDAHRMIMTHTSRLLEVKVLPTSAEGITESTIQHVVEECRHIIDITSKYIARIILNDLHTLFFEFHTYFTEPTPISENGINTTTPSTYSDAVKMIINTLNLYMPNLSKYACEPIYLQVLGICMEVIVTRYILYMKDRVSKNHKFTEYQLGLIQKDCHQLMTYFDTLKIQISPDTTPISPISADSSPFENTSESLLTDKNLVDDSDKKMEISMRSKLTYPIDILLSKYFKNKVLLEEIPVLLDVLLAESTLLSLCHTIRTRYEFYSVISGSHTNIGYGYVSTIIQACRSSNTDLMTSAQLSRLIDKVKSIVDHTPITSLSINTYENTDKSIYVKEDSVTRVFGCKSIVSMTTNSTNNSINGMTTYGGMSGTSGHNHLLSSSSSTKPPLNTTTTTTTNTNATNTHLHTPTNLSTTNSYDDWSDVRATMTGGSAKSNIMNQLNAGDDTMSIDNDTHSVTSPMKKDNSSSKYGPSASSSGLGLKKFSSFLSHQMSTHSTTTTTTTTTNANNHNHNNTYISGGNPSPTRRNKMTMMNISSYTKTARTSMINATSNVLTVTTQVLTTKPNKTIKIIREKAADLGGLAKIGKHKNTKKLDEHSIEILRILGLIDEKVDDSEEEGGRYLKDEGSDDDHEEDEDEDGSVEMSVMTGMYGGGVESIAGDDICYIKISSIKLKGIKSNSVIGGANPYIAFILGSHREKTNVIWGNKQNEWIWKDTTITFRTHLSKLSSHKLNIRVYDKERIRRKTLLGTLSVTLTGIELTGIQSWFALEGGMSMGGHEGGDLYLSVQVTYQ